MYDYIINSSSPVMRSLRIYPYSSVKVRAPHNLQFVIQEFSNAL